MAWLESETCVVLAVADGVGGMSGGAAAAQLAIELVLEHAQRADVFNTAAWVACLCDIDVQVTARSNAGETTLLALATDGIRICGAACGDSQAWLFSLPAVHELFDGKQARERIGSGCAMPRPFQETFVGSYVLAATDGLWNYTNRKAIAAVLAEKQPDEACEALANLTRLRSGALQDDCGMFLLSKRLHAPVAPNAVLKPKLSFAVPVPK